VAIGHHIGIAGIKAPWDRVGSHGHVDDLDSRQGQYSIRVNDQWRICFRWTAAGPEDVEIVDYH